MKGACVVTAAILVAAAAVTKGADVTVEGLPPRVWGGATIAVSFLLDDVSRTAPSRVRWGFVFGDRIVEAGQRPVAGPGQMDVRLTVPEVRSRIPVGFDVKLVEDDRPVGENHYDLELFPRGALAALEAICAGRPVGLVETDGREESVWDAVPVPWRRLESAASVKRFDGTFAILDAEIPLSELSDVAAALLDRVRGGMKLVCVGRAPMPLAAGENPVDVDHSDVEEVRPLAPGHALLAGLAAIVALLALLIARRGRPPSLLRPGMLVVATVLLLGQFQSYCRPLSLDNPVDPMDKPLAQAANYVKQGDFGGRLLITKHPLIRFLLPETGLRLPETTVQWSNPQAIGLWEQSPPGTIFFWDSKNCNWPDPKEQKTSRQLREMLESEGTVLAHFITDDWQPGKKCEVIIFEKLPPP